MRVIQIHFHIISYQHFSFAHDIEQLNFVEVRNEAEWQKVFEQAQAKDRWSLQTFTQIGVAIGHKLDKEVYTDPNVIQYFEEADVIKDKFPDAPETEFGYAKAFKSQCQWLPNASIPHNQ